MNLEEKTIDDILILAMTTPRLDNYVAADFKSSIAERIAKGHHRLILDLGKVTFIDSSGLGALVACLKLLGDSKSLVLSHVSAPVLSLFKLTRMDQVFRIYPTEEDALEALRV